MNPFDRATQDLPETRRSELLLAMTRMGLSPDDPMSAYLAIAGYAQESEAALLAVLNAVPANVDSWSDSVRSALNDDDWRSRLESIVDTAGKRQARRFVLGSMGTWVVALCAISAALWFGISAYWQADYDRRLQTEMKAMADLYETTPSLLSWAAQFRVVDRHPVVTERMLWASVQPEVVSWARSERGMRMNHLDRMYSGSRSGEYPCLADDTREWVVDGNKLATCIVATGWE